MRAFIAAFPPLFARQHLDDVLREYRGDADLHWQSPERWHITLAFLGLIEEPSEVARHLAAASWPGPATVQLAGSGSFGTALWIGVDADTALDHIAGITRDVARVVGAEVPHGPFIPHLTIARGAGSSRMLSTLAAYRGPAWPITTVCLVESVLGPEPRYRIVDEVPLRPTRPPAVRPDRR